MYELVLAPAQAPQAQITTFLNFGARGSEQPGSESQTIPVTPQPHSEAASGPLAVWKRPQRSQAPEALAVQRPSNSSLVASRFLSLWPDEHFAESKGFAGVPCISGLALILLCQITALALPGTASTASARAASTRLSSRAAARAANLGAKICASANAHQGFFLADSVFSCM